MVGDRFIDCESRRARDLLNEAGLDFPQHLLGSPPFAGEIETFYSPLRRLYKVIWESLIVFYAMAEHERTAKKRYLVGTSLHFSRDFPKAVPINSVIYVRYHSPVEELFEVNRSIWQR
jgi:hypothetical protein